MSKKCGCSCGCNNTCGCNNNCNTYNDFIDVLQCEERHTGPYTWNGYVWYDIEVEYNGPFFGAHRRPEPRNNGCGCGRPEPRNNGCGCR